MLKLTFLKWLSFTILLTAKTSATTFSRKPSQKYFCPEVDMVFEEGGYFGNIQCSYRCTQISKCFSVVFRPEEGVCYGCSRKFEISNLDIVPNYQYVRRFLLVEKLMKWAEAKVNCEELGGHLANINTEEKSLSVEEILKNIDSKARVWFGGNDHDFEGEFVWTDGTSVADGFENWMPNNPDNLDQRQHCLTIICQQNDIWKWDDDFCEIEYFSLCEFH